jgi:phosphopantetheinyl transferase
MNNLIVKPITGKHRILTAKVDYTSFDKLILLLKSANINLDKLETISNLKRKTEWLTVRALLINHLKQNVDIIYDNENKPHLYNYPLAISISHSHERVAISLNNNDNNGIDIQLITDKIFRIKNKFLSTKELDNINNNDIKTLTAYWSLKEALFKVYGKNDIYLKDNIEILNYNPTNQSAIGLIKIKNYQKQLNLKVEFINNYTLAYIVNS